jgi:hypothetical protein
MNNQVGGIHSNHEQSGGENAERKMGHRIYLAEISPEGHEWWAVLASFDMSGQMRHCRITSGIRSHLLFLLMPDTNLQK